MKRHDHLREEAIIDYVLQELEEEEERTIKAHLHECKKCRTLYRQWASLLKEENDVFVRTEAIKERLWQRISGGKKRLPMLKKPQIVLANVAATFLCFIFLLQSYQPSFHEKEYEVVKNDEIPIETIQAARFTREISILPVNEFPHIHGQAWINTSTNEMLIEVNGLQMLPNRDYQLWIIYADNDVYDEIIQVQDGMTRMFFRGLPIEEFKKVKASVEPRGGSKEQTGPETFLIEF